MLVRLSDYVEKDPNPHPNTIDCAEKARLICIGHAKNIIMGHFWDGIVSAFYKWPQNSSESHYDVFEHQEINVDDDEITSLPHNSGNVQNFLPKRKASQNQYRNSLKNHRIRNSELVERFLSLKSQGSESDLDHDLEVDEYDVLHNEQTKPPISPDAMREALIKRLTNNKFVFYFLSYTLPYNLRPDNQNIPIDKPPTIQLSTGRSYSSSPTRNRTNYNVHPDSKLDIYQTYNTRSHFFMNSLLYATNPTYRTYQYDELIDDGTLLDSMNMSHKRGRMGRSLSLSDGINNNATFPIQPNSQIEKLIPIDVPTYYIYHNLILDPYKPSELKNNPHSLYYSDNANSLSQQQQYQQWKLLSNLKYLKREQSYEHQQLNIIQRRIESQSLDGSTNNKTYYMKPLKMSNYEYKQKQNIRATPKYVAQSDEFYGASFEAPKETKKMENILSEVPIQKPEEIEKRNLTRKKQGTVFVRALTTMVKTKESKVDEDEEEEEDTKKESVPAPPPPPPPKITIKPATIPTNDYNEMFCDVQFDCEGLNVFRIESLYPVPIPYDQSGYFCVADCYIILSILPINEDTDNKGTVANSSLTSPDLSYRIYTWIGSEAEVDKRFCAAMFAAGLRDWLGITGTVERYYESEETDEFINLFEKMKYLDATHATESGLFVVEEKKWPKRLYQVLGNRRTRFTLVAPSALSLQSNSVFLLDLGNILVQWNGKKSTLQHKAKCRITAERIIRLERSVKGELFTFDEGFDEPEIKEEIDEIENDTNVKKNYTELSDNEVLEMFWDELGGKPIIEEGDEQISKLPVYNYNPILYSVVKPTADILERSKTVKTVSSEGGLGSKRSINTENVVDNSVPSLIVEKVPTKSNTKIDGEEEGPYMEQEEFGSNDALHSLVSQSGSLRASRASRLNIDSTSSNDISASEEVEFVEEFAEVNPVEHIVAQNIFSRSYLETDKCYVLDAGVELYIWIGSIASLQLRKNVTEFLTKIVPLRKRPKWTGVHRLVEKCESEPFKLYFDDWDSKPLAGIDWQKVKNNELVALSKRMGAPSGIKVDARALFAPPPVYQPALITEDMMNNANSLLTSFNMFLYCRGRFVHIPEEELGTLFTDEAYVFLCVYRLEEESEREKRLEKERKRIESAAEPISIKSASLSPFSDIGEITPSVSTPGVGRLACAQSPTTPTGDDPNLEAIVYFWKGKHASRLSFSTFMFKTQHEVEGLVRDMYNCSAKVIFVEQGKEPLALLAHMGNTYVARRGKREDFFREKKLKRRAPKLFHITTDHKYHTCRAIEITPRYTNLVSRNIFFIESFKEAQQSILWRGRGANREEEKHADAVAQRILSLEDLKNYRLIPQNLEPQYFHTDLLPHDENDIVLPGTENYFVPQPRFLRCSCASGEFIITELSSYSQSDLLGDSCVVLDPGSPRKMFVWIGATCSDVVVKLTRKSVEVWLEQLDDGRQLTTDWDHIRKKIVKFGELNGNFQDFTDSKKGYAISGTTSGGSSAVYERRKSGMVTFGRQGTSNSIRRRSSTVSPSAIIMDKVIAGGDDDVEWVEEGSESDVFRSYFGGWDERNGHNIDRVGNAFLRGEYSKDDDNEVKESEHEQDNSDVSTPSGGLQRNKAVKRFKTEDEVGDLLDSLLSPLKDGWSNENLEKSEDN